MMHLRDNNVKKFKKISEGLQSKLTSPIMNATFIAINYFSVVVAFLYIKHVVKWINPKHIIIRIRLDTYISAWGSDRQS